MKKSVIHAIKKTLQREFVLEKPTNLSFGHYATPIAFSLAKELKKSPLAIAEEICTKFTIGEIFQEVTPIKGYINFKLSESFLDQYATWALQNEALFGADEQNESILLEYVSANPTGPLHIGHARGAVIGDALARIGKHLGYKITTEYYVNDAGNQVDLLGLSLYLAGREHILNVPVEWPEEFYRGEYIIDLAHVAKVDGKIFLNSVIKNGESEMKYGASLDVSSISIQCEVTTQLEQNLAVTSSVKLEKSNNVDMKNWSAVRVEEEKENLDQVYWEMDPLYRESSMKKAEIFIADGISLTQILETLMQLAQYI